MYYPSMSEAMRRAVQEFEANGGELKVLATSEEPAQFYPRVRIEAGMFSGGRIWGGAYAD